MDIVIKTILPVTFLVGGLETGSKFEQILDLDELGVLFEPYPE